MPQCPVCQDQIDADDSAFVHHVDSHFRSNHDNDDGIDGITQSNPVGICTREGTGDIDFQITGDTLDFPNKKGALEICLVCGQSLKLLSETQRNVHVSDCLDGKTAPVKQSACGIGARDFNDDDLIFNEQSMTVIGQIADDDHVEPGWDVRPKSEWKDMPISKGDRWWDPVTGRVQDVPSNFSPGVIPILQSILIASIAQGTTRSAVLSYDTVHIKGAWNFDMGWGCGYRNALMGISALLINMPTYRPIFEKDIFGADPGVRRIQWWIEEAWKSGSEHFKGKLLGTRKWIGTSDLYAMFTLLGIPCDIYDFPKPKDRKAGSKSNLPTHHILQKWVRKYFAEDITDGSSDRSAFNVLMRTGENGKGRGEAIRMSAKYPLILQHMGHSRTIVGYEENGRGDINLLLFDPGRSIPRDVRAAGLAGINSRRDIIYQSHIHPLAQPTQHHRSEPFSPPFTNGASEVYDLPSSSTCELRTVEGDDAAAPEDDEVVNGGGWVRKKINSAKKKVTGPGNTPTPTEALKAFRVNLSTLSNHAAYQVLAFTGGPLLTEEQKRQRQVIKSKHICE